MRYWVKALRGGAEVVLLPVEALDEGDALRLTKNQGYSVLSVRPERFQFLRHGPGAFSLLLFSQELIALLDAGLTLVEAVEALAEKESGPVNRKILNGVLAQLYQGRTLSDAMRQFPDAFPPLYVATVRVSEKTGSLREALTRYVAYRTQMDKVRAKLLSASLYPALLIFAGGLVTLFLLLYVVPKFSHVYEDIGGNLPLFSRLLMQWGRLLEANAGLTLTMICMAAGGAAYGLTRPAVRQWLIPKLWEIPAIGERMRIYQLARFYRTLGMLLQSGIPVVTALEMAEGLLSPALRSSMREASRSIREGRSISHAMEKYGLSTPVAARMLRVGEHSGKMAQMMERIASFYEDEMARWVDWFTRLFEPLLMALIGVLIGIIVLLLYLPIFELAGSIR